MEMESQRPQRRQADVSASTTPATDTASQRAAFAELVSGLQAMSVEFDRLVFDFALAAGQIAGDPDAPARIIGMMEFAVAYHQFGLETAMDAIGDNSGVRVDIVSGEDGKGRKVTPGILVGLIGAEGSFRGGGRRVFNGVAVVEDRRGRERFIAVSITPDGFAQLHHDQYDFRKPDLISDKPIEEIFPPTRPHSNF